MLEVLGMFDCTLCLLHSAIILLSGLLETVAFEVDRKKFRRDTDVFTVFVDDVLDKLLTAQVDTYMDLLVLQGLSLDKLVSLPLITELVLKATMGVFCFVMADCGLESAAISTVLCFCLA